MGRRDAGSLRHLEFQGHGVEGLRLVPEAEALLVGDKGQRVTWLALLQVHLNSPSGGTASSGCA